MYLLLRRLALYTVLALLLATPVVAQQGGSVSGKLVDGTNTPVSYATITLLRTDSTVVNGDLSKDDGSFLIASVSTGSYLLRIESLGYKSIFKDVAVAAEGGAVKVGVVKLTQVGTTLNEVSITGEKRVMELKVDKKVFNVEKNTTSAGGSATDVLQNVPAVSVDMDGNVSLRGKSNVTILIDGKPATLLGSDVTSALQSLPAGSIESVEVITNPSARYDAQGTTGIINIVTKKDGRRGVNGSATLGAGTRDKYNGNFSISLKRGKWSTFVNSSFRINNTFHNVTNIRQDLQPDNNGNTPSYYTYEHVPRLFNGSFNSAGVTYDLNEKNSVTLTQNVNAMRWGYRDASDYYMFSQPEKLDTVLHSYRYSDALGGPLSFSTSFDYKRKFAKKGEELNVDATYASSAMNRSQNYFTVVDTPGGGSQNIRSSAPGSGGNSSLNIWADYVNPMLTENGKLGLGFKLQQYNFYSSNDPRVWYNDDTATRAIDYTQLTVYDYNQQINAAYINWNDQLGKFSYQLGLRGEDARYNGTGKVPTDTTFKNSFLNLFPSAFISYTLPADQSVYLNYSRRTNRPGFFQMMPFKDFSNPGTVSMGNPDILPEFIDNIEFSYSLTTPKSNSFIASAYFARTQNLSERVLRPITGGAEDLALGLGDQVGQLLSRPMNIASGTTFGLEGTGRLQLTKAWDATINLNFFNNQLTVGDVGSLYAAYITNNSGYGWFGKVNSNLKLPANWSLQLSGNYESPKVITQGIQRERYWIDLAVKKSFWKNKATIVVNCSDVFKTRKFINEYSTSFYTQTTTRIKETRIGNLTFTYRFGKQETGRGGPERTKSAGKKSESRKAAKPTDEDRVNNLKQNDDSDNSGGGGGGRK